MRPGNDASLDDQGTRPEIDATPLAVWMPMPLRLQSCEGMSGFFAMS